MGPIMMNSVNQAILRQASGNANLKLTVINHAFPPTLASSIVESFVDGFGSTIIFAMAMSFIPASNIVFLVKERNEKMKH